MTVKSASITTKAKRLTTTADVFVDLSLVGAQTINANLTLTIGTSLEGAVGGGGNDTLIGNALNNSLSGGGGKSAKRRAMQMLRGRG